MGNKHEHGHEHEHDKIEETDEAFEFTVLEATIRELAIEKGLFSATDYRRFMEWHDSMEAAPGGSRVVARAWVDPEYKKRLLEDGVAACKELGIDWLKPTGTGTPSDYTYFIVVENTPKLHNTMVCTLCSCYPRPVLGFAPAWYERPNFRRRLVRWPREVLAEFGTIIPKDVEVRVHDSNQKSRFMILPMRPAGTEGWSEEKLATIVTRDTMIGVSIPRIDWTTTSIPGKS
ncbi:thiocyanate hydrolase subunit gamma [Legionella drozanskii]|uniref:Thiocyanate hydrolase subunit gamma n=1 Tax=Legionella drozanskii LLAP-1 TaxID=1212489 RepID=A0A0W0SNJ7_9GAMM|nr:thiocyanate hydrolase subunit gamma [Legionella drozanskii]KTC84781.1 Thiocyanate hydrolase subunit gamma [Legionella drozanskii LLAP-1]